MSKDLKVENISDEQVKDHMINNAFNNQSVLDILQGMTLSAIVNFGHDLAKKNVNRSWENLTGAEIEDIKQDIVNQETIQSKSN
jgi:hypothetical protein|tara:strand:- start:1343 stop:1594 length:252 start_codon:yes stop_codon:yes gene_type:complete